MKIGFQMDYISDLNFKTDSTLPIIFESQKRNNINYIYHPNEIIYKKNSTYAIGYPIKFLSSDFKKYNLGLKKTLLLNSLDYIFIRKDPPYDTAYISSMHMLEQLHSKTKIINNPRGIRNSPEKLLMLNFPRLIPPTIITRSVDEVKKFLKNHKKCVIKPLYGNGGDSVFLFDIKDFNYNQILENFLSRSNEPFIIQKYLPQIIKGDKRIILINGDPVAAIRRVPAKNEIRSNIHVGGVVKKTTLTKRDIFICKSIKNTLVSNGLIFVGIDVIGDFLTEINVTSPTCIQEIKALYKTDLAKIIWDNI